MKAGRAGAGGGTFLKLGKGAFGTVGAIVAFLTALEDAGGGGVADVLTFLAGTVCRRGASLVSDLHTSTTRKMTRREVAPSVESALRLGAVAAEEGVAVDEYARSCTFCHLATRCVAADLTAASARVRESATTLDY